MSERSKGSSWQSPCRNNGRPVPKMNFKSKYSVQIHRNGYFGNSALAFILEVEKCLGLRKEYFPDANSLFK
jgi:hypothetical protein